MQIAVNNHPFFLYYKSFTYLDNGKYAYINKGKTVIWIWVFAWAVATACPWLLLFVFCAKKGSRSSRKFPAHLRRYDATFDDSEHRQREGKRTKRGLYRPENGTKTIGIQRLTVRNRFPAIFSHIHFGKKKNFFGSYCLQDRKSCAGHWRTFPRMKGNGMFF